MAKWRKRTFQNYKIQTSMSITCLKKWSQLVMIRFSCFVFYSKHAIKVKRRRGSDIPV